MAERGRPKISYAKPQDPPFLLRMKQQAGHQEDPTIEAKFEPEASNGDCAEERASLDDRPQVVTLEPGHLTQEEAEIEWEKEKELELPGNASRVIYKKPIKLEGPIAQPEDDPEHKQRDKLKRKALEKSCRHKKLKDVVAVRDTNLLSFDQDSGDDEI